MELYPPSLLIDQGLFYLLVGRETAEACHNFFNSPTLERLHGSDPSKWSLHVSLATILEAIGRKPPHLTGLSIPDHLQKSGEPEVILEWLRKELHNFFVSKSELTIAELKRAVEQQRGYCSKDGLRLFDMCITRIVELPTFHQSLLSFLEFDAIQKFDFPKTLKDQMYCFLTVFYLFRGDLKVRNASKFRLVKQLWKTVYSQSRQQLDAIAQPYLDAANSIIMVKNQTDYLDCDLVHQAVFGIEKPNGFRRVHSFTLESLETIRLRICAYKGVVKICQRELPTEMIGESPPDLVSRANGKVIACGPDGLPKRILDVALNAPALG